MIKKLKKTEKAPTEAIYNITILEMGTETLDGIIERNDAGCVAISHRKPRSKNWTTTLIPQRRVTGVSGDVGAPDGSVSFRKLIKSYDLRGTIVQSTPTQWIIRDEDGVNNQVNLTDGVEIQASTDDRAPPVAKKLKSKDGTTKKVKVKEPEAPVVKKKKKVVK